MPNYSFLQLSSDEFERFSCDLLSTILNVPLQRFAAGPDGGVDCLYSNSTRNEIVVQCKRYEDWNDLFQTMKKEVGKVLKLQPKRYIICTSVDLSPDQKDKLFQLFQPWIHSLQDIYGRGDINAALDIHPSVELRHYKLYFTSVPVFQRLLQARGLRWNQLDIKSAQEAMRSYVQTDSFDFALELLKRHNVCVITANPGCGKSMLCDALLLRHIQEQYKVAQIYRFAEEFPTSTPDENLLIYLDDFLGVTYLAETDERLFQKFMRLVVQCTQSEGRLRLLLNCRTFLFESAKHQHFETGRVKLATLECRLNEEYIARKYGVEILRCQVANSPLSDARKQELLSAVDEIVQSSCFTPRLVEQLISIDEGLEWRPQLKDSSFIWRQPFDHLLLQPGLAELIYTATANIPERGIGCSIPTLQRAWLGLISCSTSSSSATIASVHVFASLLRTLEGSFLTRREDEYTRCACVAFYNGSVADFMIKRLMSDSLVVLRLLNALRTSSQAHFLYRCMIRISPAPFPLQLLTRAVLHQDVLFGSENDDTWSDLALIIAAGRQAGLWCDQGYQLLFESAQDFFVSRQRDFCISAEAAAIVIHLMLDRAKTTDPARDGPYKSLYQNAWGVLASGCNLQMLGVLMQRVSAEQWPVDVRWIRKIARSFEEHVEDWWQDEAHRNFRRGQTILDLFYDSRSSPPPPAIRNQQQWDELLLLAHKISPRLRVRIHFLFGHRGNFADNLAHVPKRSASAQPCLPGGPVTLIPYMPTRTVHWPSEMTGGNAQTFTVPLIRMLWGCADQEDERFVQQPSHSRRIWRSQSAPELLRILETVHVEADNSQDRSFPSGSTVASRIAIAKAAQECFVSDENASFAAAIASSHQHSVSFSTQSTSSREQICASGSKRKVALPQTQPAKLRVGDCRASPADQ